jgi:hypothetical protein
MDFNRRISQLDEAIKSVAAEARSLKKDLEKADKFTAKFLADCSSVGIKKVGIDQVPQEMRETWPWSGAGSVFGIGARTDGWPAIWGVADRAGIHGGCGNSDQVQADTSNLISGIYEVKSGKWRRIEDSGSDHD